MVELPERLPRRDERAHRAFRAAVLAGLSCHPELHRPSVFVCGARAFHVERLEQVRSVGELRAQLADRAEALLALRPSASALVVPVSSMGRPTSRKAAVYDLGVWLLDGRSVRERLLLPCRVAGGRRVRLPWRPGDPCALDAASLLLAELLFEPDDGPPAAPLRLPLPQRALALAA